VAGGRGAPFQSPRIPTAGLSIVFGFGFIGIRWANIDEEAAVERVFDGSAEAVADVASCVGLDVNFRQRTTVFWTVWGNNVRVKDVLPAEQKKSGVWYRVQ
jgi:hypothetical protein